MMIAVASLWIVLHGALSVYKLSDYGFIGWGDAEVEQLARVMASSALLQLRPPGAQPLHDKNLIGQAGMHLAGAREGCRDCGRVPQLTDIHRQRTICVEAGVRLAAGRVRSVLTPSLLWSGSQSWTGERRLESATGRCCVGRCISHSATSKDRSNLRSAVSVHV